MRTLENKGVLQACKSLTGKFVCLYVFITCVWGQVVKTSCLVVLYNNGQQTRYVKQPFSGGIQCSQEKTHARYYNYGQEPMVGKFTSPRMNLPLLWILHEYIKLSYRYLSLYSYINTAILRRSFFVQWTVIKSETHSERVSGECSATNKTSVSHTSQSSVTIVEERVARL